MIICYNIYHTTYKYDIEVSYAYVKSLIIQ